MSILADRQKDDLCVYGGIVSFVCLKIFYRRHKAILDYLHSAGYTKAYEQFKEELPNLVRSSVPPISITGHSYPYYIYAPIRQPSHLNRTRRTRGSW